MSYYNTNSGRRKGGIVYIRPWRSVDALIRAATSDVATLEGEITRIGAGQVGSVLVEELLHRSTAPSLNEPVTLHLRLDHQSEQVDHTITFVEQRPVSTRETPADPAVRISYPMHDLVRALFGSTHLRKNSRCLHEMLLKRPHEPTPEAMNEFLLRRENVIRASHSLLSATEIESTSLDDLAVEFNSDKWGGLHWYTPHYKHHFNGFREESIRLLEIGIGGYDDPHSGGGSLRMWQRYFPRGLIYGLDLFKKDLSEPRIREIRGDQNDPEFLRSMVRKTGPLDIIIDDGSHVNEHILTCFHTLFPQLNPGGVYVIEDLHTSYWPTYGGDSTNLNSHNTSVGFLKSLVDGLHHKEYEQNTDFEPSYTDQHVVEIHFYHNIAFIKKGFNDECGPPRKPGKAWTDVVQKSAN